MYSIDKATIDTQSDFLKLNIHKKLTKLNNKVLNYVTRNYDMAFDVRKENNQNK